MLNPIYDSDLIAENTVYSSAEDKLCTDVKEERNNEKEVRILQENENPLYETKGSDAVLNPIYDRFACYLFSLLTLFPLSFVCI